MLLAAVVVLNLAVGGQAKGDFVFPRPLVLEIMRNPSSCGALSNREPDEATEATNANGSLFASTFEYLTSPRNLKCTLYSLSRDFS